MKHKTWIWGSMVLLCCSSLVIGQEATSDENTMTIHTSFHFDDRDRGRIEALADSLLIQIDAQLSIEGYGIVAEWAFNPSLLDEDVFESDIALTITAERNRWLLDVWHQPERSTSLKGASFWSSLPSGSLLVIERPVDGTITELAVSFTLGHSYYSLNRCDLAGEFWKQSLTILGAMEGEMALHLVAISFFQANCAVQAEDFDTALAVYDSIIVQLDDPHAKDLVPGDHYEQYHLSVVTMNRAWVLLQLGRREEALDSIQQQLDSYDCTSVDCDLADMYQLGSLVRLLTTGAQLSALGSDYDGAIALMVSAVQLSPDSSTYSVRDGAELHVLRGQMWLLLYEWDAVLEDYNTAIALDPTYPDAYFYRGVLYYSVLQAGLAWREDALADFDHYLELAPEGDLANQAVAYATAIRRELDALNN